MWRWSPHQNFSLAFIDKLEKQLFIKKTVEKDQQKCNNFNIYNVVLKKIKTPGDIIISHLCTKNLDDMIYSPWDKECDRLELVIMEHFLPFYPTSSLKTKKIRIFEKMKKIARTRYYHFTHVYQKPQSYEVLFLRYWVFGPFFPFYRPPF